MTSDIVPTFSQITAQKLFTSIDEFPVDFNHAWQWLGYNKKSDGKEALYSCGFVTNVDLRIIPQLGTLAVPRPEECIMLTIECFKIWGMMSRTATGKAIREYFLDCEKVAKQKTSFESIANNKDWDSLRSEGKKYRRTYTDRIKEAGGKGSDYAKATNQLYLGATGLDASQIKQQRGITKSKPARDALNVGELQIVAMSEWQLSEAIPNGCTLLQINQASRTQSERLKSALMVWDTNGNLLN